MILRDCFLYFGKIYTMTNEAMMSYTCVAQVCLLKVDFVRHALTEDRHSNVATKKCLRLRSFIIPELNEHFQLMNRTK